MHRSVSLSENCLERARSLLLLKIFCGTQADDVGSCGNNNQLNLRTTKDMVDAEGPRHISMTTAEFQAKAKSKAEIYRLLTVDVGA